MSAYPFKSNTHLQKANIFIFTICTSVQRKYSHCRQEGLGLGTVSVLTAPPLVLYWTWSAKVVNFNYVKASFERCVSSTVVVVRTSSIREKNKGDCIEHTNAHNKFGNKIQSLISTAIRSLMTSNLNTFLFYIVSL